MTTNAMFAKDNIRPRFLSLARPFDTAFLLLWCSLILSWMDFLPRALAFSRYPLEFYSPMGVAWLVPASGVPFWGSFFYWMTPLGLLGMNLWPRLSFAFGTGCFLIFVSIYWSLLGLYCHGTPVVFVSCFVAIAATAFAKPKDTSFVAIAVKVTFSLMFASSSYYKWKASGLSWIEPQMMSCRVFCSYSVDGRTIPLLSQAMVYSPLLASFLGFVELITQTLAFPLVTLSLFKPKLKYLRYAAFTACLLCSSGIHFGMNLFFYQFLPLCFIVLLPTNTPFSKAHFSTKWCVATIWLLMILPTFTVGIENKIFPFAAYPMFSDPSYGRSYTRLRLQNRPKDFVQREFFLLFGARHRDEQVLEYARAHRIEISELKSKQIQLKDYDYFSKSYW